MRSVEACGKRWPTNVVIVIVIIITTVSITITIIIIVIIIIIIIMIIMCRGFVALLRNKNACPDRVLKPVRLGR